MSIIKIITVSILFLSFFSLVIKAQPETGKTYPKEYWEDIDYHRGAARVKKDGKWGYISVLGKLFIPVEYDLIMFFEDGLAAAQKNEKWGFVDTANNVVIPFIYYKAKGFSEGLAVVKNKKKWGYIDNKGNTIIDFKYSKAWQFKKGMAMVEKYSRGWINKEGEVVIPLQYFMSTEFSEDGTARVKKDNKWFYINRSGQCVRDCR